MTIITNAVITAYCACALCCGKSNQPTAAGVMPKEHHTIAAPRWIPLGSRVRIKGLSWKFVVEDRTGRNYDGRFDVFIPNHEKALKFGIRTNKVTIVIKD